MVSNVTRWQPLIDPASRFQGIEIERLVGERVPTMGWKPNTTKGSVRRPSRKQRFQFRGLVFCNYVYCGSVTARSREPPLVTGGGRRRGRRPLDVSN
ncbi:hypothetical protein EVAR_88606_1 [Eumeta japonica]|uniref:Uncharacterized protein n=1 Tax=Eumeta variegata TaxID=151549 RepID=A0A4C2A3L4_EUMVA|nr:hypothetical protein EVAR_88606_1 [Eumeta japonica]